MSVKNTCLTAALIAVSILCGCSKEESIRTPLDRNALVMRFFDSISRGDGNSAAVQGRKIFEMDKRNEFINDLVTIQESNSYIRHAQASLDRGDIPGAVAALETGTKEHPDNAALKRMLGKVKQLRGARRLLLAMQKAENPTSMSSALTHAKTGLSSNISAELEKYFSEYEKKIAQLEKQRKEPLPKLAPPVKK